MSQKSFWQRPEGITGAVVLIGLLFGAGMLWSQILPTLLYLASNTLYLAGMLAALAVVVYMVLDSKMRNLVWYIYKSIMRSITGVFVKIDPISILKSYLEDLRNNLLKLSKQIGSLRGQMRQLKGLMDSNTAEIKKNMTIAEQAKKKSDEKNLTLSARKAARLQEANAKYEVLYKRMDVLNRILTKMYENSEFVLEDTHDQITVKEQEYIAIKTGHGAIQSAMSVLSGDPDKKAMFEMAMEELADDVGNKVGEMERFMDTSKNLMASIDLQNGVFEDEGLQLLERWENESPLMAAELKDKKSHAAAEKTLDLNTPPKELARKDNDYTQLFE
jgi:phage shock protein A